VTRTGLSISNIRITGPWISRTLYNGTFTNWNHLSQSLGDILINIWSDNRKIR